MGKKKNPTKQLKYGNKLKLISKQVKYMVGKKTCDTFKSRNHFIESQNRRTAWVEKEPKDHLVSTPLPWAGLPTTRPVCQELLINEMLGKKKKQPGDQDKYIYVYSNSSGRHTNPPIFINYHHS